MAIRIFAALALTLLASLAGCRVDSLQPIAAVDTVKPDPALYGLWRYREQGEIVYLHIGPQFSLAADGAASGAGRPMRIVMVDHKRAGLTDEAYTAFATRLAGQRYLSIVQLEDGKPAGYLFVRYALVDADTLRFATVDTGALRTAIERGEIAGTIKGAGPAQETVITADSAAIAAFLARDGASLFTKRFVLKRVPDR